MQGSKPWNQEYDKDGCVSLMGSSSIGIFNPENSCIFQCHFCKRKFAMSLANLAEAHEGIDKKDWDSDVRIQCTRCKRFLSKSESPLIAVVGYAIDPRRK